MDYKKFIESKNIQHMPTGFDVDEADINQAAFDWQKKLIKIAIKRGRSALFEDCGLGKTLQQLEWSRLVNTHTQKPVIIFAPLSVTRQTIREGEKFGISVKYCADSGDTINGINITNYERAHHFNLSRYSGVCLDESSIIKHFEGKFRNRLINDSIDVPFKLACSATPSPNDETELGNTAEFLGICTRAEMLSMFFINDTGNTGSWRLKGHVKENIFWQWLASWAVCIRKPSDLGYDDAGFVLPPINYNDIIIPYEGKKDTLFVEPAKSLNSIRKSMRESMHARVEKCAEIVNNSDDISVVWCNLNDESTMLTNAIHGAVEVKGTDKPEKKEKALIDFAEGKIKCLVTKPKIAMFGMNWQHCNKTIVTGLSHSYEQFYQLIRRFWRFGQTKPVYVSIVIGEREGNVMLSIKNKDLKMNRMYDQMVSHMRTITIDAIQKTDRRQTIYTPKIDMALPEFMRIAA